MSVIQSIRDKYAKWAVVAIALALIGFILTDYFSAQNRMGGAGSSTIGTINGKKIDYLDFETKLKAADAQGQQQAQQLGREYTDAERYQNNEQLWNQEVDRVVLGEEFKKSGIEVGSKEFNDWLFGQNPPADLKQRFTNQETGVYDAAAAQNAINQMKRSTNETDKAQLITYLSIMEFNRKSEKFNSILTNSIYYPKWFAEKQNAEAASLAKVSYVEYSYGKINDSTIKISDKEIEEYVSKYKENFPQEEARNVALVVFNAAATAADSILSIQQLAEKKAEFAATTEPGNFLSRYGSTIEFYDGYYGKSFIQVPVKDSIFALSKGAVYGPYLDGNSYVMAKLVDSKSMPDSAKVRHILIKTFDPQTNQPLLDDSVAKKRIDSIDVAIKGGARFDSMAVKYSNDGSAAKGGLLEMPVNQFGQTSEYFAQGKTVPEFNDFSFEGKVGEKKIVKTVYGYHLIEILGQKNFQPHYKVAYFSKNIIASPETEQRVLEEASGFASSSKDLKAFEAAITKSNGKLVKTEANNIKPTDFTIPSLNTNFSQQVNCRELVRDIYKADKGEVLKQVRIGEITNGYRYVVAAVTDVLKEGTQPASVARPRVEPILMSKKKAEQASKMLGKITTLEAAATAFQDSIKTVDSVTMDIRNRFGFDANMIGAIFNPANKGKVVTEPIEGASKLYVLRVEDVYTTSVANADIERKKSDLKANGKTMHGVYSTPAMLMRKKASIKDNRKNFY